MSEQAIQIKRTPARYMSYVALYGGYYFALAMFSSLISVYLMGKGYSAAQVSLLVSMSAVFSMVMQPIVGALQDRFGRKGVSVTLLALASGAGVAFMLQQDYIFSILFYGVTIGLVNSANPYIESLATVSPFPYRAIRIWGTIGYGVGSQAAGLVYEGISPESMYYFFAAFILIAAAGVAGTQVVGKPTESKTAEKKSNYAKDVLGNSKFLLYLLMAALFYAATNLNGTYLPTFYQGEGVSVTLTSTILFIATLMELPVIFFSGKFMDSLSVSRLIQIAFIFLIVQFGTYTLIPVPAVQAVVTIFTRSSVTMAFIMINLKAVSAIVSPQYQMSALTLVSALSKNLTTILMQNVGGALVDGFSLTFLYGVLTVVAVVGLLVAVIVKLPNNSQEKMFN